MSTTNKFYNNKLPKPSPTLILPVVYVELKYIYTLKLLWYRTCCGLEDYEWFLREKVYNVMVLECM